MCSNTRDIVVCISTLVKLIAQWHGSMQDAMRWFHAISIETGSLCIPFFMLLQLLAHMGEINQPWVRCANIKDLFCSLFYKTIKMHFWAWVHVVIIFFTELSTRPSNHETSYWSVKIADQDWNPSLKIIFQSMQKINCLCIIGCGRCAFSRPA